MSEKQPEALRLADELDELDAQFSHTGLCGEAAAELRRLHVVNQELLELAKLLLRGLDAGNIKAKPIIEMDDDAPRVEMRSLASIARAAIAKANRKSNWRSIMKLCFSTDDENFVHDDVGSLLDDLMCNGELYVGREYYEADCEALAPSDFLAGSRIDCVLDQLDEMLWDEFVGEAADNDFTSVPEEAKEELRKLLTAWITKHVNVAQYWKVVGKSRRREVTLEDVLVMESTGRKA